MRKQYPQAPENLEATIHSVIDRLAQGKLIQFSENVVSLPYYLESPIEALDIDKARRLIQEYGYINMIEIH